MSMRLLGFAALSLLMLQVGCTTDPPAPNGGGDPPPANGADAHDHPAHGPRGGHLIEFGEEEYHGEWLVDRKKGVVTVFVMDGEAKDDVPIEADSITLECWAGRNVSDKVTYQLAAVRVDGETATAKFELEDPAAAERVNMVGDGGQARVTAVIKEKSYSGDLQSHHH